MPLGAKGYILFQAQEITAGHQDLPKALVLLSEMNVSAQHVATLVDNMIQKVRKGELTTDQGLSFLEMKYNMLLSYLINLTYIVLRKCSGEKIEGDPCIDRLIEIRTVLEKIRPINHKLKYQIDKLVKTAVSGTNSSDPTNFKANPDSLIDNRGRSSEDEDSDESSKGLDEKKKHGVYIPPKFSAVHYPGINFLSYKIPNCCNWFAIFVDEQDSKRRQQERTKKMSLSSSIMQDLKDEYLDTPIEIAQGSRAQQVISKREQERQEYEETYLTRLPMNKKEKHMRRQLTTLGTLGDEITDFGSGTGKRKRKSTPKSKGKSFKRKRFH